MKQRHPDAPWYRRIPISDPDTLHRHLIARSALMNAILRDTSNCKRLETMLAEVGLLDACSRAAEPLDAMADAHGTTRARMWDRLRRTKPRDRILADDSWRAVAKGLEDFLDVFDRADTWAALAKLLVPFVRDELRLPWAWVAGELLEFIYCSCNLVIQGKRYRVRLECSPELLAAAPLGHDLRVEATLSRGAPVAECLNYVLQRALTTVAGGQRIDPDRIERDVGWYYERTVREVTWYRLGRRYYADHPRREHIGSDSRQVVKTAVRRAERELASGGWRWNAPGN